MSEYTDEFDKLLQQIIQEYFRNKYKSINYTDTYTRKSLLAFSQALTDRAMYNHCIEDRVIMHEIADDYHEWLEVNVDRLAEEDLEFKDSLDKKDVN
jgi:hypothetical protein